MAARTARRTFTRSRPSLTNWGRIFFAETVVADGTKVLLGSFALSNPGINETIRRTRGRILVMSDQASIAESVQFAFGMMVVSDLALAAGAASIPGPITDRQDDGWFVWEGIPSLITSTDGSGAFGQMTYGLPFDSKAMRKNVEGFGVAIMGEAIGGGTECSAAVSLLASRT